MYPPKPLEVVPFGPQDPLGSAGGSKQIQYLRRYFDDLGAVSVLVEPYYFDRDYLAEFSAFYSTSSAGYPNVCTRLHFFKASITSADLVNALADDVGAVSLLKDNYLGFVVLRPIPASPLGRTVVAWYPDRYPGTPRATTPSRKYHCHVAGLRLTVEGLAWQQQDSAVGACATIALWSMLHSSALDGQHGLPTTASITRAAHRTASLGSRVFPSGGLTIFQLCEAIKEHSLSPVVVPGDLARTNQSTAQGFTRERFSASCSALIRSGFPVLMIGQLENIGPHAICAAGFRSATITQAPMGKVVQHDGDVPVLYIHDDNLGPNVRFEVDTSVDGAVVLRPRAPAPLKPTTLPDPTATHPVFIPSNLVVAVPEDLRTSPDTLHQAGLKTGLLLSHVLAAVGKQQNTTMPGITMTTRFSLLQDYLGRDLATVLAANKPALAKARLELTERVSPMSKHVGVVRLGDGAVPLFDVLYDTTDSDRNHPAFAHVVFAQGLGPLLHALSHSGLLGIGEQVDAS